MSQQELGELNEEELKEVYNWIDEIPLSRPKRNIARDFSDGVMAAELVSFFFPHLVELHNYYSTNAVDKKKYNWNFLNTKVLKKLDTSISKSEVSDIVGGSNQAIEKFLLVLKYSIDQITSGQKKVEMSPPKSKTANKKGPITNNEYAAPQHIQNNSKDVMIMQLRETIDILEGKMNRLGKMLNVKDEKIRLLEEKTMALGVNM